MATGDPICLVCGGWQVNCRHMDSQPVAFVESFTRENVDVVFHGLDKVRAEPSCTCPRNFMGYRVYPGLDCLIHKGEADQWTKPQQSTKPGLPSPRTRRRKS